jgi:hypothetical protein
LGKTENCVPPDAIIAISIQNRLESGYCSLTNARSGTERRMMIEWIWTSVMKIEVCDKKIQSFDCFQVAQ